MKEIKELKLEELTPEQKVGMTMCGRIFNRWDDKLNAENLEYTLDMIREHKLGAIWVGLDYQDFDEAMKLIKETADYPILVFTDAESGLGDDKIGRHSAIGMTGSEEYAYIFGKVTGTRARKMGYSVVCNPILDMIDKNTCCNMTMRSMGSDKEQVTKLAAAIIRGMHDAGVLAVGKHYPSVQGDGDMDTHMAEGLSMETEEELLDYALYPYVELNKMGLLDGIMTGHERLPNIDPDRPASLSEKVIGVFRRQGFDGIAITDALPMMGIVAKYGKIDCNGMAIEAGNDLALTWVENKFAYEAMLSCYERGILTEEKLDLAVRRVLDAQHKTTLFGEYTELTEEELELYKKINTDGICAITDEGIEPTIDKNGKHFIAVQVPVGSADKHGKITIDTFTTTWYKPDQIIKQLEETFPNSRVFAMDEFPSVSHNWILVNENIDYDDVIVMSFMDGKAYQGEESFSGRFVTAVKALQITNRVSALLHFGNPFPLEALDHIPRLIIGGHSEKSVETGIKVLAGDYPAKGKMIYDLKLK